MVITIETTKKGFAKMLNDLFNKVDKRKKGHYNLIPLTGNNVIINSVTHFFEDNKQMYLSYDEYGDMSLEMLQGDKLNENERWNWNTRLHMSWRLKNLNELWIDAPNKYEDVDSTGEYYYELFIFKLR